MPEYDATLFSPPAPVARVTLRNPQTNVELVDQLLLIDTGADTTLVPIAALATLGMQPIANVNYEVIAFDGSKSVASVVQPRLAGHGPTLWLSKPLDLKLISRREFGSGAW